MMIRRAFALALLATPAFAQTPVAGPKMSQAQGMQLFNAAGFKLAGGGAVNGCGNRATPKFTYYDLNGDGNPEAVSFDADPKCYGPTGQFKIMARPRGGGAWRIIGGGPGIFKPLPTRTQGWADYTTDAPGCQPVWTFRNGDYAYGMPCTPDPEPVPGKVPLANLTAAERTAAFRAAGFKLVGKQWQNCGDPGTLSYGPGAIEAVKDLNGDGRAEAVITEGSVYCFGNTGTGYWIVSKQAAGGWKLITSNTGIATFLATKGAGGWPDIEVGGPGFCFPVVRWTGVEYKLHRRQYEGKPCRG